MSDRQKYGSITAARMQIHIKNIIQRIQKRTVTGTACSLFSFYFNGKPLALIKE